MAFKGMKAGIRASHLQSHPSEGDVGFLARGSPDPVGYTSLGEEPLEGPASICVLPTVAFTDIPDPPVLIYRVLPSRHRPVSL